MVLNEKQKTFAEEYLKDFNATQAAIRAGYSKKTAHSQGHRLVNHAEIVPYIQELRNEMRKVSIAEIREIEQFLTRAIRGELTEEVLIQDMIGKGKTQTVRSRKEIALKDRMKAAELLGRRYGIFSDKHEHSGTIGLVRIVDDIPEDEGDD